MALTEDQLLSGLDQADAAGNAEDAEFFANELRSRRAKGGQPQVVADVPLDGDDQADPTPPPEATIVAGIELTPEMTAEFVAGSKIADPKERSRAQAEFNGRLRSAAGEGGAGEGIINAFTRTFDIFGVPSAAGAAIGGLINDDLSITDAMAGQRAFSDAQRLKFPKSSFAGQLTGDIIGGGLIVKKGAQLVGKFGGKEALKKATVFTKKGGFGSFAARVTGAAAVGSAEGAITDGLQRGEPITGAMIGLLAPVGGEALPLLGKVIAAVLPGRVKALVRDPATKGLSILADTIGETKTEMMRRFEEFSIIFGRPPAIAEITNREAALELRKIITDSTTSSLRARRGIEALDARVAEDVSQGVTGGVKPATVARQTEARTRKADKQFSKVHDETFEFDGDDIADFLEDDELKKLFLGKTRKGIQEQAEALTDFDTGIIHGTIKLDGVTINRLRKAINRKADLSNPSNKFPEHFADLGERLNDIASAQSPAYRKAIDEFRVRSSRIEGIETGRAVIKADTPTSEAVQTAGRVLDTNVVAGERQGVRAALSDEALKGPKQATALSKRLVEDRGLNKRLRATLDAEEVNALDIVGAARQKGAENLRILDPGIKEIANDALNNVRDVTLALANIPLASKALAAVRLVQHKGAGIDRRVADNLIDDLFDPAKSQQVIDLLLTRGLSEKNIALVFLAGQSSASAARQAANE